MGIKVDANQHPDEGAGRGCQTRVPDEGAGVPRRSFEVQGPSLGTDAPEMAQGSSNEPSAPYLRHSQAQSHTQIRPSKSGEHGRNQNQWGQ